MTLLLLLGAMASAHGQIGGGHGRRQNNQQQTPQQSPAPTTSFLPEIWPRLEEGALICRSRDDLVKYQTRIANGSSAAALAQAPDCHTIRKQTGIQILAHDGPSRTQIVMTDPIATCPRPRHLNIRCRFTAAEQTRAAKTFLSPKAQAQGNDGPALGFLGNKVARSSVTGPGRRIGRAAGRGAESVDDNGALAAGQRAYPAANAFLPKPAEPEPRAATRLRRR
jgi:hypothetical protein